WRFLILCEYLANSVRDAIRLALLRFRQDQRKFVATITGGRIDGAAMYAQNRGHAAESPAAHQVAVVVVNFFQPIQIQEQHSERPPGAIGALRLTLQHVQQTPVVRQARQRIADREMSHLLEKPSIVEQGATQSQRIAAYGQDLREDEG